MCPFITLYEFYSNQTPASPQSHRSPLFSCHFHLVWYFWELPPSMRSLELPFRIDYLWNFLISPLCSTAPLASFPFKLKHRDNQNTKPKKKKFLNLKIFLLSHDHEPWPVSESQLSGKQSIISWIILFIILLIIKINEVFWKGIQASR